MSLKNNQRINGNAARRGVSRFATRDLGLLFFVTIFSFTGCGGPAMAPVTGQVTMEDQPVAGVFVVFQPQPEAGTTAATRAAMAEVDSQGKFVLSTNKAGDGVLIGRHKVMIVSVDRNREPPGELSADYHVEVQAGDNEFHIELQPR